MKKALPMHKNLPAPRSPFPEHPHPNKQSLKRTASTSKFPPEKQSLGKGISAPKSGRIAASSDKGKAKKGKSLKKSGGKEEGREKDLYTGGKGEDMLESLSEKSFKNLQGLKLNLLSYIFKNRLVRDEQYNDLYEQLVERFPTREEAIRGILFEIVSTLDS
jgi:hypothetical protein